MRKQKKILNTVIFVFLTLGSIVMLFPLIWMILTSFKPKMHVYLDGLWPKVWDISSYKQIWEEIPLIRGFFNSILYAVPPIIIGTFVSIAAAYSFAKIRFKGRDILFIILLINLMVPYPSIMVTQFVMFSNWNMLDGPWPLIIPKLCGNVSMIFFLRQYIYNLPEATLDAAKIDGANHWGIFKDIIVPMVKPAAIAHGVLWFIAAWNDYLAPTILIKNPDWQPATVMIAKFNEQYAINTHVPRIMAGSVLLLIPVLIIYGFTQKYIIGSFMFAGVKG